MENFDIRAQKLQEARERREKTPTHDVAALWKSIRDACGEDPVAHKFADDRQQELARQLLELYPAAESESESYHFAKGSTPPPGVSGKDIPGIKDQIIVELRGLYKEVAQGDP